MSRCLAALVLVALSFVLGCGARSGLEAPSVEARDASTADAAVLACRPCTADACDVLVDEIIADAFAGNDTASIALGENSRLFALLELPTAAYQGSVYERIGADDWRRVDGAAVATGALAIDPGDWTPDPHGQGPYVFLSYDGAYHTELVTTVAVAPHVAPVPTDQSVHSPDVWRDAVGTIHFVSAGETGHMPAPPTYFTWDGEHFTPTSLGPADARTVGGHLALGAHDVPWIAWSELAAGGAGPRTIRVWRGDTREMETALTTSGGPIAIAVPEVSGHDAPAIVTMDPPAVPLSIVQRDASGAWTSTMIPADCASPCAIDARTVAMVASGAELVVFFATTVRGPGDARVTTLYGASRTSPPRVILTHENADIVGVRAVLGDCAIHLAYDEIDMTTSTTHARYVALGTR